MTSKDDRISLVERAVKRMAENDGQPGAGKKPADKPAARKPEAASPGLVGAKAAEEKTAPKSASRKPASRKATSRKPAAGNAAAKTEAAPRKAVGGQASEPARVRLDLNALRKKGMVTPASGRSQLVEEMRAIKRPILRAAFPAGGSDPADMNNVLMVTSCSPGEGKTFTSINLAMSIAMERDLYVLLIDSDVYRRGTCELLGVPQGQGLVDLLLDPDKDVSRVLQKTNIENLSLLQAGTPHDHATELMASKRMVEIIKDISMRYPDRMIIMDTPPVLATSETGVIADFVGQVVVIVEEGETSKQDINQALDQIGSAKKISFILNKHRQRKKASYYGDVYRYATEG